jgi:hypothetical protein
MIAKVILGVILLVAAVVTPIVTWFYIDSWFWWLLIAVISGVVGFIGFLLVLPLILKFAVLAA